MRPCLEDLIGVGATRASLERALSVEAIGARAVFHRFEGEVLQALRGSSLGRELIERGVLEDIEMAAEL